MENENMNAKPDFRSEVSWANRLDQYRDTPWVRACLETIVEDARKVGNHEYARAAQEAIDGDFSDLDWLIAEMDLLQEAHGIAHDIEVRTGREIDPGLIADQIRDGRDWEDLL